MADLVVTYDDLIEDEHMTALGLFDESQERLWEQIALFGMVVDHDCPMRDLVGFYKNPNQELDGSWYFPGDLIDVVYVSLDSPPTVDVAYDSKGVAA